MSIFSELGVRESKDRLKEELLYNLAFCYVLIEKEIEKILVPFGLSAVKMNALLIIKHVGKEAGLSQVDICRRMIVSAGNITRLIDRLERENLVERIAHAVDRRVNLIRITKKGSDILNKAWPVYKKKVNEVVSLTDADISKTAGSLDRLRRSISQASYRRIKNESM